VSSVALRRAVDALPGKDPVVQRPEDGFCKWFASDRGRQVLRLPEPIQVLLLRSAQRGAIRIAHLREVRHVGLVAGRTA
jgi:hypothetical protein